MSTLSLRRVSFHPWVVMRVVRPALVGFTRGTTSVEGRRTVARLLKTLDEAVNPDDFPFVESPYARLSRAEVARRAKRNEEILKEDPISGREKQDEIVGNRVAIGFRPL